VVLKNGEVERSVYYINLCLPFDPTPTHTRGEGAASQPRRFEIFHPGDISLNVFGHKQLDSRIKLSMV